MHVSVLHLNPRNPHVVSETGDVCGLHTRIVDATTGMPADGPRVLYAIPRANLLVIRAPEAITTARLPRDYALTITSRPWSGPDTPGRWRMAAVVNPARNATIGGPTLNQPDRRRRPAPPCLYADEQRQIEWLTARLRAATIVDRSIVGTQVARGRHRTGRTITVRRVTIEAIVDVHDPEVVTAAVVGGVGIDKTWGCGLTLWQRA